MKTYLLEADDDTTLPALAAKLGNGRFQAKRFRAVAVVEKMPPKKYVRQVLDGDQFSAVKKGWLNRTILDELHEEYVRAAPVHPATAAAAIRRWQEAIVERQGIEEQLEEARTREREASENVVRTHGKAPVVIDGQMYDPGFRKETVFLIPRRMNNGGDE